MSDEHRWGSCPKCNGPYDMHYRLWCPMCDKPQPQLVPVYDFFEVARYIAAHEGYEYGNYTSDNLDKHWVRKLLREIEFPGNDSTITWFIEGDKDASPEELAEMLAKDYEGATLQFNLGLLKYFDIKLNQEIKFEISW